MQQPDVVKDMALELMLARREWRDLAVDFAKLYKANHAGEDMPVYRIPPGAAYWEVVDWNGDSFDRIQYPVRRCAWTTSRVVKGIEALEVALNRLRAMLPRDAWVDVTTDNDEFEEEERPYTVHVMVTTSGVARPDDEVYAVLDSSFDDHESALGMMLSAPEE